MISAIPHDSSTKVDALVVGKYSRQKSLTSFIPMRIIAASIQLDDRVRMIAIHLPFEFEPQPRPSIKPAATATISVGRISYELYRPG
jgi:hypothetical protein